MSNSGIYNGQSEGFEYLTNCYYDYAKEVIRGRAIPDVRDGLKPVQRRILYAATLIRKPHLLKCATIVSEAMKLHPHGDSSVYGAFTLMTDENGTWNIPVFHGMGNLGHVWSSDPPAAYRYPKYMLNDNADDFFRDKEIMKLVQSEEGDGEEPVVLPVNYPVVLVNGTDGIAVSAGTRIPSFNFGDVVDLTVKYLQEGDLGVTDIIVPDFPTGGILVQNDAEIAKIMATGKGKLKLRAKVVIEGKEIIVQEIPFGKTVESMIKAIDKAEIREISKTIEMSGRDSNGFFAIECKNKKFVEYVLMELYRRNILQNVFASNILVTDGGEPLIVGVHDIIKRWCSWRSACLKEKFSLLLEGIKSELETLDYFNRLIANEEWRLAYVTRTSKEGRSSADAYLKEIFPDIPSEVCTWIIGRALSAFHNGDKYINRYNNLLDLKEDYTKYLNDTESYMIQELLELKANKKGQYERKTQATYTDYKFSKISDSDVIEDESYCVWTFRKNGFLLKTRGLYEVDDSIKDDILCQFEGYANSILIGFDCFGRVLKVVGSEIPFTAMNSNGVYLPKYFDTPDHEEYKILYMGLLDGSKRMLVYRDGYVGFLDTSEWYGKKTIKIVQNGVCLAVYDKLLEVIEEKDFPEFLMVADDSTGKIKLGVTHVPEIPERSRTSRAKVFSGSDIDIHYLKGFNGMDMYTFVESPELYMDRVKVFKGVFYGDSEELVDGRYLELCQDYPEEEE